MTDPDPMKPTLPGDEFRPYEAPKGPVEKKPRGCFFYGCIISLIFLVLIAIGIGLLAWYGINQGNKFINDYTDTTPLPIPAVEMPAEERKALDERYETFKTELDEKKPTEPLVLTADEINALIDEQPQLKGRVHVDLEGDKINGVVSLPLEEMIGPNIGPFSLKGRYFNGKGTFVASLVDGAIDVRLQDGEVRGKPLPEQLKAEFAKKNLFEDAKLDEEQRRMIAKFERIEVKDGKLYVIPRKPSSESAEDEATKPEATPAEEPKPSGDDATVGPTPEDMPKEEAAPAEETPKEESPPVEEPAAEPKTEEETPKEPQGAAFIKTFDPSLLCFATIGFRMPSFPG